MKEILKGVHLLKLGTVNAYLIESDELILIDTGYEGDARKIISYINKIGRNSDDLKHILVTHVHSDHSGNARELQKITGAKLYLHRDDASLAEKGECTRENMKMEPGLINKLIYYLIIKKAPKAIKPFKVDTILSDKQELKIGKGFTCIHIPGHCRGQLAFLYHDHGELLFAADLCANAVSPAYSTLNEDAEQCRRDVEHVLNYEFDKAVFGHGKPILANANNKLRLKLK